MKTQEERMRELLAEPKPTQRWRGTLGIVEMGTLLAKDAETAKEMFLMPVMLDQFRWALDGDQEPEELLTVTSVTNEQEE